MHAAFLIFDLEEVTYMEAQGFQPLAFHLDLRVGGVSGAVHVVSIACAAGILNFNVLGFCHGVLLSEFCDEAVGFKCSCFLPAVSAVAAFCSVFFHLVLVMAFNLPDAGIKAAPVTMAVHGRIRPAVTVVYCIVCVDAGGGPWRSGKHRNAGGGPYHGRSHGSGIRHRRGAGGCWEQRN